MADFDVSSYASADAALNDIDTECNKVIVTDIRMPGLTGLDLLKRVREIDSGIPVILITGQADIATAVQAMRDGAYDFLEKPFSADNLIEVIRRAYDKRMLIMENRHLKTELELHNIPGHRLIGKAPATAWAVGVSNSSAVTVTLPDEICIFIATAPYRDRR